ncbi:LysR family transcriptional regulator [Marinovum sp.]|uniref:LysR family transcriptional regulator n=1 Tax=Marinovum sp. TaxID=2024839 RepID=UPI002B269BC5|nr:LysR family transcriptional regulator [Marinovum sp.]
MDWTALPPLAALRAFAAFADKGAVQPAGDALNVSHAAISQQIRNLETHIGLTLLDRSGRAMVLTPEGQRLADALLEGLGGVARACDELTGRDADRPLMVSATPSFASSWLMPRLADFRAANPAVSLMIDPTADVKPVEPGGIDVALRYGSGDWPGLDAELLVTSPIAVVAATSLVGSREFDDLNDLRAFHWLQELGTNEATEWFARLGVGRNRAMGISSLPGNLMIEAARQGQGIAITARIFIEEDVAAGRLRVLFEDVRKKGYFIVTRPGVQRPPLRRFVTWLRQQGKAPPMTAG